MECTLCCKNDKEKDDQDDKEEDWISVFDYFMKFTCSRSDRHRAAANYWNGIGNFVNFWLILGSSVATMVSLVEEKELPRYTLTIITGIVSFFSAINGFLSPIRRKERHIKASKEYTVLMLTMAKAKTLEDFENLWMKLLEEIISEPFLIKRNKVDMMKARFKMSKELSKIFDEEK